MNYNFFLLKIGSLESKQREELTEYVNTVPMDLSTTDWDMTRHKGVIGRQFSREECTPLIQSIITGPVFHMFAVGSFIGHEIVKLPPGAFLHEHTDSYTTKQGCSVTHRVHIPLTGNADYWFRRDEGLAPMALRMELGGIYLFNNYVLHSVTPIGPNTRTNLMMDFRDVSLDAKVIIYDKFKIQWRF